MPLGGQLAGARVGAATLIVPTTPVTQGAALQIVTLVTPLQVQSFHRLRTKKEDTKKANRTYPLEKWKNKDLNLKK